MFDFANLTLAATLGLVVLTLAAGLTWAGFLARADRLPAATRYADIRERVALAQAELRRAEDAKRDLDRQIQDRDRLAAEVAHMQTRVDELRLELENLAPAREEIDLVKRQAAEAAREKEEMQGEVRALREEAERLQEAAERLRAELDPARIAELEQRKAAAEMELARIQTELARARPELETALRRLSEANEAEARVAILKLRGEELRKETEELRDERTELERRCDSMNAELASAQRTISAAQEADAKIAALAKRSEDLGNDIRKLQEGVEELRSEAARLRDEQTALVLQREALSAQVDAEQTKLEAASTGQREAEARREAAEKLQRELETRIASLEETLQRLRQDPPSAGGAARGAAPLVRAEALADLLAQPACLASPDTMRGAARTETDALHAVARHLKESGLSFANRTLHAFHTALKINDTAQLTVLAGVSGTGKSLLPRRYAEAMGIHFLQVAVEPRWDSPQDLLGFYNYVEGKYRATELARLMAHLDPWQALDLPQNAPDKRDHMALVLLDEMNLARVEYYFSEFLSRLEARPAWRRGLTQDDCKDALIPVDIRGLENPPRLFPAHNVLFVGTMNDDESTQSLSDKVLDRGNILQFPAPSEFPPPLAHTAPAPSADAQRFAEWRGWVKGPGALNQPQADQVRETVAELSQIMQGFGRPFGHRLNQAIRAYVANYPFEGNAGLDLRAALADQVEFRILPKLRGVEIDSHRDRFDAIIGLIRNRLDDRGLADRLNDICEDQVRGSNLFQWRGLMRRD